LLKRVWDFASVDGVAEVNADVADKALTRLEVDRVGLDSADRRYLNYIAEHYNGGPVGVETLAAGLSEERDAIEETIEPFLLQQGLIQRTSRGRMLTQSAYQHLGLEAPERPAEQQDLLATEDCDGEA
jgi:Holliday junction DNA helicase RuvB